MHQDGSLDGFDFGIEYEDAFRGEAFDGTVHQVVGTERVQEARVLRAGIDKSGQPQLADAVKPLEVGVFDDVA